LFAASPFPDRGDPGAVRVFFLVGGVAARVRQETLQSGALDRQVSPDPLGAHLEEKTRNGI
jgi:hypothetical protein